MAKKDIQSEKLKGFADMLKSSPAKAPIQEIRPIEQQSEHEDPKEIMKQLNVLIRGSILKAAKKHSVINDIPLKDMVDQALEAYLKSLGAIE
ncbi:hypothetical protein [Adhaeribacter aquaticus]|uniref:hypothetical protein n=1 Tax=Adhaeribacter aquaticus TaxID=299567 RepID=UPI0004113005|nr:hypothetical protein [Adhaeribacter aquaticus]